MPTVLIKSVRVPDPEKIGSQMILVRCTWEGEASSYHGHRSVTEWLLFQDNEPMLWSLYARIHGFSSSDVRVQLNCLRVTLRSVMSFGEHAILWCGIKSKNVACYTEMLFFFCWRATCFEMEQVMRSESDIL